MALPPPPRSARRRLRPALALAAALLGLHGAMPAAATAPPTGAIVSGEAAATAAGLAILAGGGNAVDAAVATALVLAVVHPEAGNLGGGGFAVVRVNDELAALDFRECAPAAARPDMYLDAGGEPVPRASLDGPLAAAVPGSPAGLHELHRRFGRLPWARVVEPALALARDGFEVSIRTARQLALERDRLARFPDSAALWLPDGLPRGAGERLVLPALARTLTAYRDQGPTGITSGPVAAAIEAASRRHGGVLTAADLAAYRPVWRTPLRFERRGWQVATMPLPSSGGVLVGQMSHLLDRLGWRELPRGGAERAHLLAEAARRAYADRFRLADPATTEVTAEELLAAAWLARRAGEISRAHASPSAGVSPHPAEPPSSEPAETTHLSVIDGEGNLVALSTTLNEIFGGAFWVAEAGFFLNDEMDDFATAPGRPNSFGLVQGAANAVAPGRRPLSSMAPLLAWRGAEALAIGGRGGSRIPTGVLQALLSFWEGDRAQAAVTRPRLHHQWLPDRLEAEPGALSASDLAELARRGHTVVEPRSFARISLVARRADGTFDLGADPRGPEAGAVLVSPLRPPGPADGSR